MKRKKIGMLKQIILVSLALQAIYANTFLGKVIDAKTGMPIIEANIQVNDSEHIGTITNKSGIFSLPVTNLKNINIKKWTFWPRKPMLMEKLLKFHFE